MMARGPAAVIPNADFPNWDSVTLPLGTPAFDATAFAELSEMIGEDGVMDMVAIFETETRRRVDRLAAGDQDLATQMREMHTLKGAAGTVGAPRLTALGRRFEEAAGKGIAPRRADVAAIEPELDAYLASVRVWSRRRQLVD